tara:strand:- start:733 stop:1020 length:288 start_codon:yes stop_codon:yes gene_type:complete
MSGWFSALATALDPLCGPVGIFSLLGQGTVVACGDAGWGDEIAFGVKVTVTLAVATLPIGLALGFLIALAAQSQDRLLRVAVASTRRSFAGCPNC